MSLGAGGHSRVLLPKGQLFGAQGQAGQLQRRVHDMWCQGLRKGPCSNSPTSASVISRTVNIAYRYEIIEMVLCPTVCSFSHCTSQVLWALS